MLTSHIPADDAGRLALVRERLGTAVLGDVLDALGRHHQFLPQPIQPVREHLRLAGRAMPVLLRDVYGRQQAPFGRLTEALDQLQSGDVYLAGATRARCAAWALATRVLVGMHPLLTQVPPMSLRSTTATRCPAAVSRPASGGPA